MFGRVEKAKTYLFSLIHVFAKKNINDSMIVSISPGRSGMSTKSNSSKLMIGYWKEIQAMEPPPAMEMAVGMEMETERIYCVGWN